jgi:hypothetical protein
VGASQSISRKDYCISIALRHPWDIAVASHAMAVACPLDLLKLMIGVDSMETPVDSRVHMRSSLS